MPVALFIYSLCLYKVYKQSFIYSVWFSQAVWLNLGSLGKKNPKTNHRNLVATLPLERIAPTQDNTYDSKYPSTVCWDVQTKHSFSEKLPACF